MAKVKRMEKGVVELWTYDANGNPMPELVEKHFWMCTGCGLVWATREDARRCEERGHKPYYYRLYGGRFVNGVHVGGHRIKISAIRREVISNDTH